MKFKFVLAGLLFVNLTLSFAQKTRKADTRPNIILIMVDDMGYSDVGSYGSEIQTPNLDNLAKEGIRFREFYNNSICAPTRASLITGQYPHKAGIGYFDVNLGLPAYQGYLNKESLTFAEVLRNAGYSTLMSGKWHVGGDSLAWPNQRGFDHFYGFIKGASNYFDIGAYGQAPPVELVKDNKRINLKPGQYLTDEITTNALDFLDVQEKTGKPFFCMSPLMRRIGRCRHCRKILPNTKAGMRLAGTRFGMNGLTSKKHSVFRIQNRRSPGEMRKFRLGII